MADPTYASIWATLSKQDCSSFGEEAGPVLPELEGAWAWGLLMEHFPQAEFEFGENDVYPDASVSVNCTVTIGKCALHVVAGDGL